MSNHVSLPPIRFFCQVADILIRHVSLHWPSCTLPPFQSLCSPRPQSFISPPDLSILFQILPGHKRPIFAHILSSLALSFSLSLSLFRTRRLCLTTYLPFPSSPGRSVSPGLSLSVAYGTISVSPRLLKLRISLSWLLTGAPGAKWQPADHILASTHD